MICYRGWKLVERVNKNQNPKQRMQWHTLYTIKYKIIDDIQFNGVDFI